MPNRATELFLVDILISIEKVKRYSRSVKSTEELLANDLIYSAVTRELKIIGEAIKYVLADPALSQFIHEHWREIVDFRNVLAHEYFGLNANEIFSIATREIFEFEFDFVEFIRKQASPMFLDALMHAKQEATNNRWHDSLAYLRSIEKLVQI